VRRMVWLALGLVLVLAGCGGPARKATGPAAPGTPWPLWRVPAFGVALRHPPGWTVAPGYLARRQGRTGFVSLNALQGAGLSARAAAQAQLDQPLDPFGAKPRLEPTRIDGEQAYLILPSADQAAQYQGMAEALVLYPKPQAISGTPYRYLIVTATSRYLQRVVATLKFSQGP